MGHGTYIMETVKTEYALGNSHLHGLGILAQVDIAQGAMIIAEEALLELLTPCEMTIDQQIEDWLQRIGQMTEIHEAALLTIDKAAKQSGMPALDTTSLDHIREDPKVFQRLRQTFFQYACPFAPPSNERAVVRRMCGLIGFLNHGCTPNAVLNWNVDTRRMVLTAVQPIKAGDEVLVCF